MEVYKLLILRKLDKNTTKRNTRVKEDDVLVCWCAACSGSPGMRAAGACRVSWICSILSFLTHQSAELVLSNTYQISARTVFNLAASLLCIHLAV